MQLKRVRNVGREGLVRVMQSGKDRGVETERQRIVEFDLILIPRLPRTPNRVSRSSK